MKLKHISVYVPEEVHQQAKTIAAVENLTVSQLIAKIIKELAEEEKYRGILRALQEFNKNSD